MRKRKGNILAGDSGTRLHPATMGRGDARIDARRLEALAERFAKRGYGDDLRELAAEGPAA
jgi:hypothetical protein